MQDEIAKSLGYDIVHPVSSSTVASARLADGAHPSVTDAVKGGGIIASSTSRFGEAAARVVDGGHWPGPNIAAFERTAGAGRMEQAEIGLIGLGVMGSNLALNIAEKGHRIAVFNRTTARTTEFAETAGPLRDMIVPCESLEALQPPSSRRARSSS